MSNKFNFDKVLFICIILLCGLGLATIASIAPNLFLPQLIFILFGIGAFLFFSNLDYQLLGTLSVPTYISAIILLGITLLIGIVSRGASRWIAIGGFRLQFSEILKPFLIVGFANLLVRSEKDWQKIIFGILWILPVVILIFKQPDLGGSVVYIISFLFMIFFSQVNIMILLGSLVLIFLSLPLFWNLLADYQKKRLLTFFNPTNDVLGSSYNAIQAVITVGAGMLFGTGLGRGTQTHLLFLPEKQTDFIFASFAEEFGFVGSIFMLTIYLILLLRLWSIIKKTEDPSGQLIGVGILGILFAQIVINIGMNLGLVPVTGITLPLISYGGSSILATLIGLGIASNIGQKQRQYSKMSIQ